jgi:hypothetical protein
MCSRYFAARKRSNVRPKTPGFKWFILYQKKIKRSSGPLLIRLTIDVILSRTPPGDWKSSSRSWGKAKQKDSFPRSDWRQIIHCVVCEKRKSVRNDRPWRRLFDLFTTAFERLQETQLPSMRIENTVNYASWGIWTEGRENFGVYDTIFLFLFFLSLRSEWNSGNMSSHPKVWLEAPMKINRKNLDDIAKFRDHMIKRFEQETEFARTKPLQKEKDFVKVKDSHHDLSFTSTSKWENKINLCARSDFLKVPKCLISTCLYDRIGEMMDRSTDFWTNRPFNRLTAWYHLSSLARNWSGAALIVIKLHHSP